MTIQYAARACVYVCIHKRVVCIVILCSFTRIVIPFLWTVNQRFLISIRMGGLALCTSRVSESYSTIRTLETHLSCTHHPLPLSANHLNRYRRKKREEILHLQFTMIQHWHSHVVSVYTCFDVYLCCAGMRVRVRVCVYVCVICVVLYRARRVCVSPC